MKISNLIASDSQWCVIQIELPEHDQSLKKGIKPKVGSTKNRKSDPENGATVLLSVKGKKNA